MKYLTKLVSSKYLLNRDIVKKLGIPLVDEEGRYVTIIPERVDEVEAASGRKIAYTVLEYHNAYTAVPLTDEGKIVMVKVPRYPIGSYLWELPGGKHDPGETPEECVKRELAEETGFQAGHIERLLPFYNPEPSHSTEELGLFLVTNLTRVDTAVPEREGLLPVGLFDLDEVLRMIGSGEIKSSWTVIGILAYLVRLRLLREYSLINPGSYG